MKPKSAHCEQLKHGNNCKDKEPIEGKSFGSAFRKAGYRVQVVDEWRTRCRCSSCSGECETCRECENRSRIVVARSYDTDLSSVRLAWGCRIGTRRPHQTCGDGHSAQYENTIQNIFNEPKARSLVLHRYLHNQDLHGDDKTHSRCSTM